MTLDHQPLPGGGNLRFVRVFADPENLVVVDEHFQDLAVGIPKMKNVRAIRLDEWSYSLIQFYTLGLANSSKPVLQQVY